MPVEPRRWTSTRDAERWPYAVRCSQIGCYFTVACGSPAEGEEILQKHESQGPCPYDRKGSTAMPLGKSLREQQWEMLDAAVDAAMAESGWRAYEPRGEIKGIAKCIYLMDQPYWESPEAVMKEAAERLKMRKGEIPKRATPGCEVPHSVQMLGERTRVAAKSTPTKPATNPVDAKIRSLDPKVLGRILRGVEAGLDPEMLAEMNGVSLAIVKRIAAQPQRFAPTGG